MSNGRRRRSPRAAFAVALLLGGFALAVPTSGQAEPAPKLEEVQKQVDVLYEEAEQATEQAHDVRVRMNEIRRRVDKLEADVGRQEKNVERLRRQIGQFAAAQYRAGGIDTTTQLLAADDPDEFLARVPAEGRSACEPPSAAEAADRESGPARGRAHSLSRSGPCRN